MVSADKQIVTLILPVPLPNVPLHERTQHNGTQSTESQHMTAVISQNELLLAGRGKERLAKRTH